MRIVCIKQPSQAVFSFSYYFRFFYPQQNVVEIL